MTDRAESILAAVKSAVTGLTTTGDRVVRGRVYPVGTPPALSVNMGDEAPSGAPNMAYQDEALTVEITAHVRVKESDGVDIALNQIRAEVYAALLADRTLGLPYVRDVRWQGRIAPLRDDGAEQPTASQTLRFTVLYRHSYSSTEG